jgi:CheY-like chemotaxis protein
VKHKTIVLVVEDDFLIRINAADMIRDLGFEVFEAVDADNAIRFLEESDDVSVVFTDIQMPGSMDGLTLIAVVADRWPPIALLVTSGQVAPKDEDMPPGARFLSKPYIQGQLKGHLDILTGHAA